MPKSWMICLAAMLAACSTAPDDLPPVDPLPVSEVSETGDDATEETEPYDPSKDLTLITCGAHETLDLVGGPLADAQPRLPEKARVINPGDLVTQDYDSSRMNVFVDASGTITKIDCG